MHTLNLGNANIALIHLPKECQCRDKSVNWLRPQQRWGSPNTERAQQLDQPLHAGTQLNLGQPDWRCES